MAVWDEQRTVRTVYHLVKGAGSERDHRARLVPIDGPDGRPVRYRCVECDYSRPATEEELVR